MVFPQRCPFFGWFGLAKFNFYGLAKPVEHQRIPCDFFSTPLGFLKVLGSRINHPNLITSRTIMALHRAINIISQLRLYIISHLQLAVWATTEVVPMVAIPISRSLRDALPGTPGRLGETRQEEKDHGGPMDTGRKRLVVAMEIHTYVYIYIYLYVCICMHTYIHICVYM